MLTDLIRFLDKYIGNVIIFFLALIPRKKYHLTNLPLNKSLAKEILCIKIWTLGESLLTLPSIDRLHKEGYKISVLCTKNNIKVFENSGIPINIIEFNLKYLFLLIFRWNQFSYSIDFEPYFRFTALISYWISKVNIGYNPLFRSRIYKFPIRYNDKIHTVKMMTKLLTPLGIFFEPKSLLSMKYSDKDKQYVDDFIKIVIKKNNISCDKIIAIHAGGASSSDLSSARVYPKERFSEIAKFCSEKGYIVFLTGTKLEYELNEYIRQSVNTEKIVNIANQFSLTQFAYLLTNLKLFISNDTGPMHLAAAMKCKVFAIFGPELPQRYGPFPIEENYLAHNPESCSYLPCISVHKGVYNKCRMNNVCIRSITTKEIITRLDKLLD